MDPGESWRPPRVNALSRPRLIELMTQLWRRQLALVVAPAGAGKTTLLAQFAASSDAPVVWYRAGRAESSAAQLLDCLGRRCAGSLGVADGWTDVGSAVAALEGYSGPPALLVLDDLHMLAGTDAEAALRALVSDQPAGVRLLIASRHIPDLNVGRPRLAGALLELGADDLRFRSWEIDRLFREHYKDPLLPEDVARLGQHTEGWAAGLSLFHLATAGKPANQRREVLTGLRSRARLVREYLSGNVLDELPEGVRHFITETCVLGVLTGPLCDELLGRVGSAEVLDLLERRQAFIEVSEDGQTSRYHEVMRACLESALVDRFSHADVCARYRRAGVLLERSGALCEALRAYVRAEEWTEVDRILTQFGEDLAGDTGSWLDVLPAALLDEDPWLQLATARRHRAAGRLAAALAAYRQAEAGLAGKSALACQRERFGLAVWTEAVPRASEDWLGLLRQATWREPLAVVRRGRNGPEVGHRLTAGLAALLAGDLPAARTLLDHVATEAGATPLIGVAAGLANAVVDHLLGPPPPMATWERLALGAERAGSPWLARVVRAASALTGGQAAIDAAASVARQCRAEADGWGSALASLLQGMGALADGAPDPTPLDLATDDFRILGAGVLEAWARAYLAQAQAALDAPTAVPAALSAESFARAAGSAGARAVAFQALADAEPHRRDVVTNAAVLAAECGFAPLTPTSPVTAALRITCFGRFSVWRGDDEVDLSRLRPQACGVLQVLAASAGGAVHWEVLAAAIWPDADHKVAARNLHVAISSIRQVLDPTAGPRRSTTLVRRGATYQLVVSDVDVRVFEHLIEQSRRELANDDRSAAVESLGRGLQLYDADLLAEAGPAEWAVERRERLRDVAAEAARTLAELHLLAGRHSQAAAAARRGLRHERYQDQLWALLFEALADDVVELFRSRAQYATVLGELCLD